MYCGTSSPILVGITTYLTVSEAALAVDMVKPVAYPAMVAKIYENCDKFTDIETYDKSRSDIYQELAVLAVECGVDEEGFLKTLMLNTLGGQKNGGNGATGALKLAVKHARQRGMSSPTLLTTHTKFTQIY
jgi:hypothetical protein